MTRLTDMDGDLFGSDAPALAHGVNCAGVMGAGVAKQFRARYPVMFAAYRELCNEGTLTPGDLFPWQDPDTGRWVYNLATQGKPGKNARYEAVETAVFRMVEHARENGVARVALPEIGCGIGGLSWGKVAPILERHARGSGIRLDAWHLQQGRPRWASWLLPSG